MHPMPMLFTDAEVAARLDALTSIAAMRAAIVAAHEGRLVAPPRASAPLPGGRLVMTAGQLADQWYGFRS
jgi:ornithine cyclodeaminase